MLVSSNSQLSLLQCCTVICGLRCRLLLIPAVCVAVQAMCLAGVRPALQVNQACWA